MMSDETSWFGILHGVLRANGVRLFTYVPDRVLTPASSRNPGRLRSNRQRPPDAATRGPLHLLTVAMRALALETTA